MKESAGDRWPRPYMCFLCADDDGIAIRATVRISSGQYGGGGFPTCDEHLAQVSERALREVFSPEARRSISSSYTVTARAVAISEHGDPKMGRLLWRAKPRTSGALAAAFPLYDQVQR